LTEMEQTVHLSAEKSLYMLTSPPGPITTTEQPTDRLARIGQSSTHRGRGGGLLSEVYAEPVQSRGSRPLDGELRRHGYTIIQKIPVAHDGLSTPAESSLCFVWARRGARVPQEVWVAVLTGATSILPSKGGAEYPLPTSTKDYGWNIPANTGSLQYSNRRRQRLARSHGT
jgi:hypothetical protein